MTYLIDGYNLMHAVGALGGRTPAKGLERARTRFLDWLAERAKGRPGDELRVVFDAQKGPAPSSEYGHGGVRVLFAFRRTADELIEELVQGLARPRQVGVVTNDAQVQEAARRRRCEVVTCQAFVDRLITAPKGQPAAGAAVKPAPEASPEEMAAWLDAFTRPGPRKPK